MKHAKVLVALIAATAWSGTLWSAVTEDEAKQLGSTLTPFGAEKAGNNEKTIPEYTGGLTAPPASYKSGSGIRPDPFPDDKPLYAIDAKNMDQYADKLSEGTKALLKKYPSFRIDVYPTRRTVAYPKPILEASVKNATQCKTAEGGLALIEECRGGAPFPIPKDGLEVMWNHLIRFQGYWYDIKARTYYVDSSGRTVLADEFTASQEWPYYIDDAKQTDVYYRVRSDKLQTRSVGVINMFYDYLNPVETGRRAWTYAPGQRRVRVAPDFTYDTPTDSSGGIETFDDVQLFSGKMDRYDFKLVGKKEIIMPYNMYKAVYETKAEDLLNPNHANPDKIRWELHRAWVVEATLKPGKRHIYSKRVFYWDEDWGGGVVDLYDSTGRIWRVKYGKAVPSYEIPAPNTLSTYSLDLINGVYAWLTHTVESGGYAVGQRKPSSFFTPEAMQGAGIR